MKKLTKKQSERFRTLAIEYAQSNGAENVTYGLYTRKIEGKTNDLYLYFDDNSGSGFYSVFGKFRDVNGLSPINGKYNVYISIEFSPDEASNEFKKYLEKALTYLN